MGRPPNPSQGWPTDAAVTLPAVRSRHQLMTPVLLLRLGPWRVERAEMELGTFREGHGYRDGMPARELVDSTRAWWRVNPREVERRGIRHAVAVYQGRTLTVVEIGEWFQRESDGRWAFSAARVTEGPVFDEWVGSHGRGVHLGRGRNPVRYSTSL